MGKKEITIVSWWYHVNPDWVFVGTPRTWVYAGSTPEEPDFHLMSLFAYHCPRHDKTHHRRVKGYREEDLADALNSLPPEVCDGVTFRYQPDEITGLKDRGYHLPQIDELGDYWPNRAGQNARIKVRSKVAYL